MILFIQTKINKQFALKIIVNIIIPNSTTLIISLLKVVNNNVHWWMIQLQKNIFGQNVDFALQNSTHAYFLQVPVNSWSQICQDFCSKLLFYDQFHWNFPDSNVHGANMGPTWVLSAPMGPMLVPWKLLSGLSWCHGMAMLFHYLPFVTVTTSWWWAPIGNAVHC